jgi:hypothetical protein
MKNLLKNKICWKLVKLSKNFFMTTGIENFFWWPNHSFLKTIAKLQ